MKETSFIFLLSRSSSSFCKLIIKPNIASSGGDALHPRRRDAMPLENLHFVCATLRSVRTIMEET